MKKKKTNQVSDLMFGIFGRMADSELDSRELSKEKKNAEPMKDSDHVRVIQASWKRCKKAITNLLNKVKPSGWTEEEGVIKFLFDSSNLTNDLRKSLESIVLPENEVTSIVKKFSLKLLMGESVELAWLNNLLRDYGHVLTVIWDQQSKLKIMNGEKPDPTHFVLTTLDKCQVVTPPSPSKD